MGNSKKVHDHEPKLSDELKKQPQFQHLMKDVPEERVEDVMEEVEFVSGKWQAAYDELLKAFEDPEVADKFREAAKERWKMES